MPCNVMMIDIETETRVKWETFGHVLCMAHNTSSTIRQSPDVWTLKQSHNLLHGLLAALIGLNARVGFETY